MLGYFGRGYKNLYMTQDLQNISASLGLYKKTKCTIKVKGSSLLRDAIFGFKRIWLDDS